MQALHNSTAANMGFAIARFPYLTDTLLQFGSSVLRMKFCNLQEFGVIKEYYINSQ